MTDGSIGIHFRRLTAGAVIALLMAVCVPQTPALAAELAQSDGGRIVRTESGERYYLDDRGVLHRIVREARDPGGAAGIFYYIEDDDRPLVQEGPSRLYYRDSSGALHALEPVPPAVGAAPYTIVPGRAFRPPQAESCARQLEECLAGCRGISPRQASDRPNCLAICDQIRAGCVDR